MLQAFDHKVVVWHLDSKHTFALRTCESTGDVHEYWGNEAGGGITAGGGGRKVSGVTERYEKAFLISCPWCL